MAVAVMPAARVVNRNPFIQDDLLVSAGLQHAQQQVAGDFQAVGDHRANLDSFPTDPAQAEANIAYLKGMLSQRNSWAEIQSADADAKAKTGG